MYKLLLLFTLLSFQVYSQQMSIEGKVMDESTGEPLVMATLMLNSPKDSVFFRSIQSDANGSFTFKALPKGYYLLKVSYVAYKTQMVPAPLLSSNLKNLNISLEPSHELLNEVEVKGKLTRAQMLGDTTQFNAEAFKVNPDASAEDLIRKMPGITTQDGKVQAQGEDVQRVLVDGKEFFTNDVNVALKNLPAEIIDKVQVFDRLSDQSQFSGVDDGNTEKTINILTKKGKSNGEFGKIYAGYGTDDRFNAGSNLNYFNKDLRVSLIGISNNINQQNFSSDDLLGVLGSSGSSRRGGRSRGRGGATANSSDFLTSNQGGITQTNAIGFNLNDEWGKKVKLNLSYFYNHTANKSRDSLLQTNFLRENATQLYNEASQGQRNNRNHRINLRMEYKINDKNSFIFTPRVSFQNAVVSDFLDAMTTRNDILVNTNSSTNMDENTAQSVALNLLYRHRFEKRGHTFSIGIGTNNGDQRYESNLFAESDIISAQNQELNQLLNQESSRIVFNNTYNIRTDYSYPLSEHWGLRFSYNASLVNNESGQSTFDFNPETDSYNLLNEPLSNSFINNYNTHRASVGIRYFKGRDFMVFANLNYQYATLEGVQAFPSQFNTRTSFKNLLPFAMLRYKISEKKNLRVFYRASASPPSINQLQSVLDNSNPVQLSIGNPQLDQEIGHQITMRYNSINEEKVQTFFAYLVASTDINNISNVSYFAENDTTVRGVDLLRGTWLSLPENYGNTRTLRSFASYGFPAPFLGSNINVNLGLNYNFTPGIVNNQENNAENTAATFGTVIGSNISENIDFTISYNGSYNWVENSLQPELESNYYRQYLKLSLNLLSKKGTILNIQGMNTSLFGLEGFEQNFTLVNAKLGQKFLKNDLGEINVSAFDILGQNNSITRSLASSYIADTKSLVLSRFFMINFIYTLRNFR